MPDANAVRAAMPFAIAIVPMARHSFGGFARWAFATDLRHRDRHGRMLS